MIRKKSGFLTFCFAFLPGAGQMYMGFMKRGATLMSSFFLLIFLSTWLNMSPLLFAMPVIWFFAFFDTFNLHAMPDDEFYALEDDYLTIPGLSKDKTAQILQGKYRNIIAIILIIIGFSMLWNNICDIFEQFLPEIISDSMSQFGHYFPQFIVALGIIAFGVYLIQGKKRELNSTDKISELEDKGRKEF